MLWNFVFWLNVFVWLWYKEILVKFSWFINFVRKVICLFKELIIVIFNEGKIIFKGIFGNFVFVLIL